MEHAIEHMGKVVAMSSSVIEEAAEELVGKSKRKWALILIAFILGGVAVVGAIALERRRINSPEADAGATLDLTTDSESHVDASDRSAWSARRAQFARADVAVRARIGRAGDRLNVRRHTAT